MELRSGGIVELDLVQGAEGAEYRCVLHTPSAAWRGTAKVAADGAISLEVTGEGDPPAFLVKHANAFLRSARKGRPDWPSRINRWRPG